MNSFLIHQKSDDTWELDIKTFALFHEINQSLTEAFGPGSRNPKSKWRSSWAKLIPEHNDPFRTNGSGAPYQIFIKDPQIIAFVTLKFA